MPDKTVDMMMSAQVELQRCLNENAPIVEELECHIENSPSQKPYWPQIVRSINQKN